MFSAALYADDYPTRPITIVAVFGPGSASDTICRIIADRSSKALGQPIVVEDRPGADGALAALYVHHQPADGYTSIDGDQLAAVRRSVPAQGRQLRRREGFRPGHAGRQLYADAGGRSQTADPFGQGTGRLRQGQSRQAVVCQRQHRRHRRRRHAGALGRHQHAARALQEHAAGAGRHHRRPRLDDVRRLHHRHAACRKPARCGRWR